MKYFVILIFSLLLTSCGGSMEREESLRNPTVTKQLPERTSVIIGDYSETLDDVSVKIKQTPEFNACMQSNISQCVQTSAMQTAQKEKSSEFCEELISSDQKESCKFAVVMISVQENWDAKLCEGLSQNFEKACNSQAYKIQAMRTKDITRCNQIPIPEKTQSDSLNTHQATNERSQCIMNVIMWNPDAKESECRKIGNTVLEALCTTSLQQRGRIPPIRSATGKSNQPIPNKNTKSWSTNS